MSGHDAGLRLSVVVPTCGRIALLRRCLDALAAQRFDPEAFEIIVVDDGRDEATRAAVAAFSAARNGAPSIRYLRPHGAKGPAAARNAGWRSAAGPIVAFTDDDTFAAPDWLASGEAALDPGSGLALAAVAGRVRVPPREGHGDDARPTDHELMTQGLERTEFVTANAFVRREALVAIDGFDEHFTRAWREDSDLQFRLEQSGHRVGRAEAAVVFHPVRQEPWGVSLRQQKNAFFEPLLYKKHRRLYRERILAAPPWTFYAIVAASVVAVGAALAGQAASALVAAAVSLALIAVFAARRLRATSRTPSHVAEMLVTSAVIPFLSIYWRLRGAWHFRVFYL